MVRISWNFVAIGLLAITCFGIGACSTGASESAVCKYGQSVPCQCLNGTVASVACLSDGSGYGQCQCPGITGAGAAGVSGTSTVAAQGSGGNVVTTAGTSAVAGKGGQTAGAGGKAASTAGTTGGRAGGAGTSAAGKGGKGGNTGAAGAAGATNAATDDLEEVRQLCVDTINNYRATVSLGPLKRPSAEVETCSDAGAKQDGDSGVPHGSAGNCSSWKVAGSPLRGGQNACPGYPVGGTWGGMGSTLGEVLVFCLKQMWDEGEPPQGRAACMQDYAGCGMQHGHYMNMTDTTYTAVSCGFYNMGNNTWWMNQDF